MSEYRFVYFDVGNLFTFDSWRKRLNFFNSQSIFNIDIPPCFFRKMKYSLKKWHSLKYDIAILPELYFQNSVREISLISRGSWSLRDSAEYFPLRNISPHVPGIMLLWVLSWISAFLLILAVTFSLGKFLIGVSLHLFLDDAGAEKSSDQPDQSIKQSINDLHVHTGTTVILSPSH